MLRLYGRGWQGFALHGDEVARAVLSDAEDFDLGNSVFVTGHG